MFSSFTMAPLKSLFFGLALIPFALAGSNSHIARSLQYHEARSSTPSGFMALGPASPEKTLTLRFALSQTDPEGLISALYDVSDPASPNYRKHLSKAEVCDVQIDTRTRY